MRRNRRNGRGAFACVYRARNAGIVGHLVEQALTARLDIALWALDESVSALQQWTRGVGHGARVPLLNELTAKLPIGSLQTLVIADDDVMFATGTLPELLRIAEDGGFGLAQPAHAPDSHYSHALTRRRILTTARLTTFVEIGPIVVIRAPWITRVVPFPDQYGMGWGLDVVWSDLRMDGCRLGIVDAIEIRHVGPAGREYDLVPERARLAQLCHARGLRRIEDIQQTLARWPAWRRVPPWTSKETEAHGAV